MPDVNSPSLLERVLAYLRANDFRRASFERLIGNVQGIENEYSLHDLVRNNYRIFEAVTISGHRPGLKIRTSWDGVLPGVISTTPAPTTPTLSNEFIAPVSEKFSESDLSIPETVVARAKPCPITVLVDRAATASDSVDAETFSKAALNVANALWAHANAKLCEDQVRPVVAQN